MITRFKYRNIYDLSKLSNISLLKDLDISSIIDHSHFEHFKKLENDNVNIKAFLMMIFFLKISDIGLILMIFVKNIFLIILMTK